MSTRTKADTSRAETTLFERAQAQLRLAHMTLHHDATATDPDKAWMVAKLHPADGSWDGVLAFGPTWRQAFAAQLHCAQCGRKHPVSRLHCRECGRPSAFVHPATLLCHACAEGEHRD